MIHKPQPLVPWVQKSSPHRWNFSLLVGLSLLLICSALSLADPFLTPLSSGFPCSCLCQCEGPLGGEAGTAHYWGRPWSVLA